MSPNKKSDFILLSELTQKLKNNNYYRTFAKSLLLTANENNTLPTDNKLVEEMFRYFIQENKLDIYYYNRRILETDIESEAHRRAVKKTKKKEELEIKKEFERMLIWKNEIYIKVQDLKKLYANNCIVFPKSLLADCVISKDIPSRKI